MSGTNSISNLTAADLIEIIKVSAESGVSRFKVGEVEVEFKAEAKKPSPELEYTVPSPEEISEAEDLELARNEMDFRSEQLEMALIENPQLAEELLASGDLLDDDGIRDDE